MGRNNRRAIEAVPGGARQTKAIPSLPFIDTAGSIKLIELSNNPPDPTEWDSYVRLHPHGTVFHLTAWQKFIQSSFGHRPQHIIARDSGTSHIVGLLPLFYVRSLIFGRMLSSTPQAAYGGILADSEKVEAAILERAEEIAREMNVRFLELRKFRSLLSHPSLIAKDLYVTFRGEISSDPEKVFLSIPRKTRAEAREGIKNGLEFKINEIDVDRFHDVYAQSVRQLGTPVFSRKLFSSGMREFGQDCKIFSVHWRGKLVAAVWTLFYKDEVIPYYGGSIREYNLLGVNNFMYWMLLKYGCEHGYRIFDFGRSKKETGSFNFKKRWGMVMSDLPYQYCLVRDTELPDTSPLNPKFSLGIRLWRHLPLSFTKMLGPAIARHLI